MRGGVRSELEMSVLVVERKDSLRSVRCVWMNTGSVSGRAGNPRRSAHFSHRHYPTADSRAPGPRPPVQQHHAFTPFPAPPSPTTAIVEYLPPRRPSTRFTTGPPSSCAFLVMSLRAEEAFSWVAARLGAEEVKLRRATARRVVDDLVANIFGGDVEN